MPAPATTSIELEVSLLVDVRCPKGRASRSRVRVPLAIPAGELPVVGRFLKGADLKVEYRGRDGIAFRSLPDLPSPTRRMDLDAVASRLGTILQSRFLPPLGHEHALTGETVRSYGVPAGRWEDLEGWDLTAAERRLEAAREAAWRNLALCGEEILGATAFPIWRANPEWNSLSLDDASINSSPFVINCQFGIRRLEAAAAYVEALAEKGAPQIVGSIVSIDPDYDRADDLVSLAAALCARISEDVGPEVVDLPAELVGAFHEVDAVRRFGGPASRLDASELLSSVVRLRDWFDSPSGGGAPLQGGLEREWRKCRVRLLQIEGIGLPLPQPTSAPGVAR